MRRPLVSLVLTLTVAAPLAAQGGQDTVKIRTVPVAGGVYLLMGQGGNIGVSTGEDAVFLVDDQYAPLADRIVAAVRAVSPEPIKFLVNTHWHGDHTGGNEHFGASGVVIVAHDNVRHRMSVEQFLARFNQKVPPSPKAALPVITFNDQVTFHLNGDDIHVIHVPSAHTDGDAMVRWTRANVLHTGDVFFNGGYPFVDLSSGGSVDGMIEAVKVALGLVDDQTRIIPGHGQLGGKADLVAYRDMLVATRDAVKRLVDRGQSREAVLAAKPTARWDAEWGHGFIKPDDWVGTIYDSLTGAQQ